MQKMQTKYELKYELPPLLSAFEASLASLDPASEPESREAAKSAMLMRLLESPPPLTGEKLIETIVRSDDQDITFSLKEYVKSARFSAATFGVVIGLLGGVVLGLAIGVGVSFLWTQPQQIGPVREIHHIPYFIDPNLLLDTSNSSRAAQ